MMAFVLQMIACLLKESKLHNVCMQEMRTCGSSDMDNFGVNCSTARRSAHELDNVAGALDGITKELLLQLKMWMRR